jgi:glycosyltransferase involved in cell wall biosynthesis
MKNRPLVSVVMNCYNGEKFLRQAVESVLAQSYENWEIIFWDNQSTDLSAEIFNSFQDPRLKYHRAPKHTLLYEARNYALEKTSGEFLAFLDVDDWWLPERLEKQIPLFADPEVGILCCNYSVVSTPKNKQWLAHANAVPTGWVLEDLLKTYYVGLLTLVVRRTALDTIGRAFDPRYHIIGDYDLVVRLADHWKLDYVHEPLACYRLHAENESVKRRLLQVEELEGWLAEVKETAAFGPSVNLNVVEARITYIKTMYELLSANKTGAFGLIRRLPWGVDKLRLLLALLLPTRIVRQLKN